MLTKWAMTQHWYMISETSDDYIPEICMPLA